MSLSAVVRAAASAGVVLVVADGRLKGRGVRPAPAFLAELRAHEAEIVALLQAPMRPRGYSDTQWIAAWIDAARLGYGLLSSRYAKDDHARQ